MMVMTGSVEEDLTKREYLPAQVGVIMEAHEIETLERHMWRWELGCMGGQHSCACLGFEQ